MEQDEPGHAEHSSEETPDHNDPEGRTYQTAPGQEHSPDAVSYTHLRVHETS